MVFEASHPTRLFGWSEYEKWGRDLGLLAGGGDTALPCDALKMEVQYDRDHRPFALFHFFRKRGEQKIGISYFRVVSIRST